MLIASIRRRAKFKKIGQAPLEKGLSESMRPDALPSWINLKG